MSSFGTLFKVTTFGESHCKGVGCIVEGVPPRMLLDTKDIQTQLSRRRPGQSALTTPRNEKDAVHILSGTECGITLGTPIALMVHNEDQRPHDYSNMADVPRPSHADYTYQVKYGCRASSGGGRASARETIGRVAAGAIAEKWLADQFGTKIVAWVSGVGTLHSSKALEDGSVTREMVDQTTVRCPDAEMAKEMTKLIAATRDDHDSIGGVVTVVCTGVPVGLGEPVFDKLEAMLAHAMLSIPATKGFEIGSGFEGCTMKGSQHNDMYAPKTAAATPAQNGSESASAKQASGAFALPLGTLTNRSGGVQGGISNGEPIVLRIAFKPPATIGQAQHSVDFSGANNTLKAEGRHDPCVVPRAVPIVEAMAALVLADAALIQESRIQASRNYPIMGKVRQHTKPQEQQVEAATAPATTAQPQQ